MWRFQAVAPTAYVTRVVDAVARWSPANGLSKTLNEYSDAELDRALALAGRRREDLFRTFRGNARHRQLMAHMIEHFGVDLAYAVRHDWDRLKGAEGMCVECRSIGRCRRWIAWGRRNDAARIFCPNATLFDEMARAGAERVSQRGSPPISH